MTEANCCLVECRLAEDYLTRREPYRQDHLNLLRQAEANGTLLLAGALAEPADRSILIWTHREPADEFIAADPYRSAGVVTEYSVRPWVAAVGVAIGLLPDTQGHGGHP